MHVRIGAEIVQFLGLLQLPEQNLHSYMDKLSVYNHISLNHPAFYLEILVRKESQTLHGQHFKQILGNRLDRVQHDHQKDDHRYFAQLFVLFSHITTYLPDKGLILGVGFDVCSVEKVQAFS
jgi:hypothetical protein